jgi:hypothetical protein
LQKDDDQRWSFFLFDGLVSMKTGINVGVIRDIGLICDKTMGVH